MGDFFNTLKGKIIAVLTIIALVFGIVAEGVTIYRNGEEAKTATETANNAAKLKLAEAEERAQLAKKAAEDAKTAAANAETARAAADNAAKLKLAEAEEKAQLAKKAAADAEKSKEDAKTAKAIAENAERLKIAEAEEKTQLAKKAAAEAETQRAIAENSARKQRAEADDMEAKARLDAESADTQKYVNGLLAGTEDPHWARKRMENSVDRFFGGNETTARAQPAPPQVSLTPSLHVKSDASLNLRNGPGRRHNVLAELPAGTVLHQVGSCIPSDDGVTRDPWCKVDWNGTTGWASSSGLERVQQ